MAARCSGSGPLKVAHLAAPPRARRSPHAPRLPVCALHRRRRRRWPPRPLSVAPTIDTALVCFCFGHDYTRHVCVNLYFECHFRGQLCDKYSVLTQLRNTFLHFRRRASTSPPSHITEVVVVRSSASVVLRPCQPTRSKYEADVTDVIDLGAPVLLRRHAAPRRTPARPVTTYTPNPRLYPGPQPKPKPKPKLRPNHAESRGNDARGRRRKHVLRRCVPNPRLYRPAPPQPPRPPALPRTHWAPPEPPALLETASYVALRLSEQRRSTRAPQRSSLAERSKVRAARSPVRAARSTVRVTCSPVRAVRSPVRKERLKVRAARSPVWADFSPGRADRSPVHTRCLLQPRARAGSPSRRLVVTLPGGPQAHRYRPASEYFRQRSLDSESSASTPAAALAGARTPLPGAAMDAGNRHSTSPEDCSEGNETQSAPSEFLSEFLSAIMRRQYAEALKYCRLILQYEPHNATARGFYPLLQHKVQAHRQAEQGGWARGSSSEEASAHTDPLLAAPPAHEMMEQGADESSRASRSSSRSRGSCASQSSLELDSSEALAHSSPSVSLGHSGSPGCWDSTGSEPDDNGNAPAAATAAAPACTADLHTDNAPPHKSESAASLRRLRAQFTCSIK